MRRRAGGYNPKRRIVPPGTLSVAEGEALAARVGYGGNPEHKRTPGDYGLAPPANPRPGKTLCDAERQFLRADALALLRAGAAKGLVSVQARHGLPQNIWAVSDSGVAFEAELENQHSATYHGYPMPLNDEFRRIVLKEWQSR